jgi:hypothetical protein
MAVLAPGPKLGSMLVLMTRQALLGQTQKSSISILELKSAQFFLRYKLFSMALLAGKAGVLPLQRIAALSVIKRVASSWPDNDIERPLHVFGMAPHTVSLRSGPADHMRVVSALLRQALLNFIVAIQTFELGTSAAQTVTSSASGQ